MGDGFSEIICNRKVDVSVHTLEFMRSLKRPDPLERPCDSCQEPVLWDRGIPPGTTMETLRWICKHCFLDRGGFRAGDNVELTPMAEEAVELLGYDAEEVKVWLPLMIDRLKE